MKRQIAPDIQKSISAVYAKDRKDKLIVYDDEGKERFSIRILPDGSFHFEFLKNVVLALGDSNRFVVKDRAVL